MREVQGHVVRYPWGTTDAIPAILGIEGDSSPVAEYWLGAHPLAPSWVGEESLADALRRDPSLLGEASVTQFGARLPYLMKILSARHALSVQVHPSREQAEEGYAREDAAGLPVASPVRSYKDDWPKPEILVALDEFHTLVGFRDPAETYALFEGLGALGLVRDIVGPLVDRAGVAGLQEVFLDILSVADDRRAMVDQVLAMAMARRDAPGALGEFARTAVELDGSFPSDPGILGALLMNRVRLAPGEAVYVAAGVPHAHLRGTGIEVMANSDNVIRGGLTNKHVAVDELVRLVDFSPSAPEILAGVEAQPGAWAYRTECPEFSVWRLEVAPGRDVLAPDEGRARIALVTSGEVALTDATGSLVLPRGRSAFLAAGNSPATFSGAGQVFVSGPGVG